MASAAGVTAVHRGVLRGRLRALPAGRQPAVRSAGARVRGGRRQGLRADHRRVSQPVRAAVQLPPAARPQARPPAPPTTSTPCPPCTSSRAARSPTQVPGSTGSAGCRRPCRRRSVADPATVLTTPPKWMEMAFEASAKGLRAIGKGRYAHRRRRRNHHLRAAAAAQASPLCPPAQPRRRRSAPGGGEAAGARELPQLRPHDHRHHLDPRHLARRDVRSRPHPRGREPAQHARRGAGGILVLAHFGSWDIAASMALAAGHPVTTVMAPVGTPSITALLAWSRKVKQMELFAPAAAARGLLRALRQGRVGGNPRRHPGGRSDHRGALLQWPGGVQHRAGVPRAAHRRAAGADQLLAHRRRVPRRRRASPSIRTRTTTSRR